MHTLADLLDRLHGDYLSLNPEAKRVYELLSARGEHPLNDHIALRTYGDPRLDIDVVARPFEAHGYQRVQSYEFEEKNLRAWHFLHAQPEQPKLFISELILEHLPASARAIIGGLLDQLPAGFADAPDFVAAGRPWSISSSDYEALRGVSEYAAWVAAFGLRANHFTVDVNSLHGFDDLLELNHFLAEQGVRLNEAGGRIKGRPEDGLQQSSTMAGNVSVSFSDGERTVPACYVEFAQRFPVDGELFTGFVAQSADRIFESTDRAKPVTERFSVDEVKRRLKG